MEVEARGSEAQAYLSLHRQSMLHETLVQSSKIKKKEEEERERNEGEEKGGKNILTSELSTHA